MCPTAILANASIPQSNNYLSLEPEDSAFENISMHSTCRFAFRENMTTRETDWGLLGAETQPRSTLPKCNFPEWYSVTSDCTTNPKT